jgi:hypothetical protein
VLIERQIQSVQVHVPYIDEAALGHTTGVSKAQISRSSSTT